MTDPQRPVRTAPRSPRRTGLAVALVVALVLVGGVAVALLPALLGTAPATAAGGSSSVAGAPWDAVVATAPGLAVPADRRAPASASTSIAVDAVLAVDATAADPSVTGPGSDAPASGLAASGIPTTAVEAYQAAAAAQTCGIDWTLVAAIGRVESDHGRFGGATLHTDGTSSPRVIGIPLDGRPGVATIADTDGGRYDGDSRHDRAVGPMQFIPGTWARYATDGDGDGRADPFDLHDAAAAAAAYLCTAGGDLSTVSGQVRAVLAYNHSQSYVATVLGLAATYAGSGTTVLPTPVAPPTEPPAARSELPTTAPPTTAPPTTTAPPVAAPPTTAPPLPPTTPSTTPPTTTAPQVPTTTPVPPPACALVGAPALVDVVDAIGRPGGADQLVADLASAGLTVGTVTVADLGRAGVEGPDGDPEVQWLANALGRPDLVRVGVVDRVTLVLGSGARTLELLAAVAALPDCT